MRNQWPGLYMKPPYLTPVGFALRLLYTGLSGRLVYRRGAWHIYLIDLPSVHILKPPPPYRPPPPPPPHTHTPWGPTTGLISPVVTALPYSYYFSSVRHSMSSLHRGFGRAERRAVNSDDHGPDPMYNITPKDSPDFNEARAPERQTSALFPAPTPAPRQPPYIHRSQRFSRTTTWAIMCELCGPGDSQQQTADDHHNPRGWEYKL